MSGLELITVLGVAASAAQLIDYSLKVIAAVSDIYSRVKDAPKRVVRYTSQVHALVEAGRAIQDIQDLRRSRLVYCQLEATLLEVKQLDQVLACIRLDYTTGSRSKRVWRTIVGDKERRILTCFERLEKEKTALILCISVVHTQTLQTIGNGVELLVERDMGRVSDLVGKFNGKNTNQKMGDAEEISAPPNNQLVRMPKSNSSAHRDAPKPEPENPKPSQSQNGSQTFTDVQCFNHATQINGDYKALVDNAHTFQGCKSNDQTFQFNGNHGTSGAHEHREAVATGSSIQFNGNSGPGISYEEIKKSAGG